MRTRRSESSSDPVPREAGHRSVLLQESIDGLAIEADDTVLDATLGGAGHAKRIASQLAQDGTLIGFDLDSDAIGRAAQRLEEAVCKKILIEANFRDMKRELALRGIQSITKALFDLGWSSYQLDSGRGFSFGSDEPLAMSYAKEAPLDAATVVNTWSESSLADIIFGFGEERYARRIARAIVDRRVGQRFKSSRELASCVVSAVPAAYRRGRLHPATRTFQALRIAVNDELGALEDGLEGAHALLARHGRIAVITFHSLEDRIVKRAFAQWEEVDAGRRLNKKPIAPSESECAENPRARSAKLRIFERS